MNEHDIREWHYIKALKACRLPRHVLCVDTETCGEKDPHHKGRLLHSLRLWVASYWREDYRRTESATIHTGTEIKRFWQLLRSVSKEKTVTWVFAHNVGFDATVLGVWEYAQRQDIEFIQQDHANRKGGRRKDGVKWCGVAVVDDPPTILKFRFKGSAATVCIVDTYNYFRCSLEEMGNDFGIAKLPMPDKDASEEEWREYCYGDIKILSFAVKSIIETVRDYRLGSMPYTASGLAMNAYRARFLRAQPGILVHGDGRALQLERDAHHGGLCQCFFRGTVYGGPVNDGSRQFATKPHIRDDGGIYVLDRTSHYPAVMHGNTFPCKLLRCRVAPPMTELGTDDVANNAIARVRLDCGLPGYPVTRKGRTFVAVGKIVTSLCGPELLRAQKEGSIRRVEALATYVMDDLFSDFVEHFYDMRRAFEVHGNKAMASVCKVILNSLYGKFAQWNHRWVDDNDRMAPQPFGYWFETAVNGEAPTVYRALGWLPQMQRGKAESPHSCPAISAYVTAYAREDMLRFIEIAGANNVYYSDTDSLHCNERGYLAMCFAGLVQENKLGLFRLAGEYSEVEYIGPKQYVADGVPTIAGLKSSAVQVKPGIWKQPRFARLATILAGEAVSRVAVDEQYFEVRPWQPEGSVDRFGRVSPVELKEW